MNFKLISLMFIVVLLIGTVSAFEFDNVENYNAETKTYTINNCDIWIGTCLNIGEELVQAQLTTPLVNKVHRGEDVLVGEFTYKTSEDFLNTFGDIYLEDLNNNRNTISRGEQFKYKVYKEVSVDDYEYVNCVDVEGDYQQGCDKVETGSHLETQVEWIPILKPGNVFIPNTQYEIGIFIDVEEGDYGDWKPTFLGEVVDEWAEWQESYTVGLVSYYSYDEGGGSIAIDQISENNLDLVANDRRVGKELLANFHTAGSSQRDVNLTPIGFGSGATSIAASFWVNRTGAGTGMMGIGEGGAGTYFFINDDLASFGGEANDIAWSGVTQGVWTHIVYMTDGTGNLTVWKNGELDAEKDNGNPNFNFNNIRIGFTPGLNVYQDGMMDEIAIWNRTLEHSEITALYDGGAGTFFTPIVPPTVTLNSPIDFFNTTQSSIDFNWTVTDDFQVDNSTLYIDDAFNQTIIHGTSNFTNEQVTVSFIDGSYNWTVVAYDNESRISTNTTRFFTIDTTAPTINLISPIGIISTIVIGENLSLNWTVSDTNLDTCWFDYNNINTTVTCGDNNYSFITIQGEQSLIFYANDTINNLGSDTTSWTYEFIENSQTFNNQTIEGSLETFLANITLESGTSVSSTLFFYDGSSNIAESFISGPNNILRISNFVIPNVAEQQQFNFNFQVTLSDSSIINLSTQSQTVSNISIDDCTTNSFELYNFTLIDEEEQDTLSINTTIEISVNVLSVDREITVTSLSNNFNNTNPVLICLNNITGDSSYVVDVTVRYEAQDHVIEYYNIRNATITNETTISNIFLFDLLTDDSTDFQLTFKGSDFVAVEGALVSIQRQYISENVFKTVELPITDANGQTIVHLVRNDVVYNIIVSKDNSVLGTFNNIIAFCEDFTIGNCQINLNAFSSTEEVFNYNDALGISFTTIIYNETTRIASINFLTSDGTTKTVNFTMSKDDIFGNNSVCSSQVVSSGGTLTCTVPTFIDTSPLTAQVFVDGEQSIIDSIYLTTRNIGTFGYFIMFLMILSITMMLLSSKTMTLIGLFVGVGSSMVLTLVEGKVIGAGSSLIWLAVVIIAMIWKLNKGKVE